MKFPTTDELNTFFNDSQNTFNDYLIKHDELCRLSIKPNDVEFSLPKDDQNYSKELQRLRIEKNKLLDVFNNAFLTFAQNQTGLSEKSITHIWTTVENMYYDYAEIDKYELFIKFIEMYSNIQTIEQSVNNER